MNLFTATTMSSVEVWRDDALAHRPVHSRRGERLRNLNRNGTFRTRPGDHQGSCAGTKLAPASLMFSGSTGFAGVFSRCRALGDIRLAASLTFVQHVPTGSSSLNESQHPAMPSRIKAMVTFTRSLSWSRTSQSEEESCMVGLFVCLLVFVSLLLAQSRACLTGVDDLSKPSTSG